MSASIPTARIEQAVGGTELPGDEPVRCADCGTRLSEGAPVTVGARRRDAVDAPWRIVAVWGVACAEHELVETDLNITTPVVLVEGDVAAVVDTARQDHWLCLARPELVDHAGGAEA